MPASIGVNLRVTGHCRQGGRKYMEDFFSVAYQQTEDEKDLEYAFFGIYDGHGGGEAATFAKEHLMESIVRQKNFWSDKDEDVLKAIKEGYIATHYAMWKEQEKWPKTASGLPSTAGTTASVAFIRRGKIYIGHVGDSGIILGYQEPGHSVWKARALTKDHKPENANEMSRIEQCGGKVVTKSGVPRVVWNRPRIGHKGPVRRSTPIDEIPFLAVARSLGDLWSYNSALDEFVVSPDPDTCCIPIDTDTFRCLIFGTDGLWNMISATAAVSIVQVAENHNERTVLAAADNTTPQQPQQPQVRSKMWINPSKCLVERALERWSSTRMRADNTSVITLMLDPPGPPRAEVIKSQNRNRRSEVQQTANPVNNTQNQDNQDQTSPDQSNGDQNAASPVPAYPENGLEIVTVYREEPAPSSPLPMPAQASEDVYIVPDTLPQSQEQPQPPPEQSETYDSTAETSEPPVKRYTEEYLEKIHREVIQVDTPTETKTAKPEADVVVVEKPSIEPVVPLRVETIQINEVSSSSSLDKSSRDDETPCARCTRSHDVGRRSGLAEHKLAKPSRSSSESPKRKTRQGRPLVAQRNAVGGAKREHSEPDTDSATGASDTRGDDGRLAGGPATNSEPPQKLRRSRSLGPTVVPKEFSLRSSGASGLGRCLRERDRAVGGRHTMAAPSTTSASTFRRLNGTRSFTPVRSPMQTRNRVKRLNNK